MAHGIPGDTIIADGKPNDWHPAQALERIFEKKTEEYIKMDDDHSKWDEGYLCAINDIEDILAQMHKLADEAKTKLRARWYEYRFNRADLED